MAVVGGGLGGLAASLRLAASGHAVSLHEAADSLGGKMNRWSSGGFRFDTGPSLVTLPFVFEELFESAGTRLADHVRMVAIRPHARCRFDDGTEFDVSSSLPAWMELLKSLEPRDLGGFHRFLALGSRLWELSKETFLRRSPTSPPDLRGLRALRHAPLLSGWGNYHRTVRSLFRNPYLVQVFDRYPTYVGSSPYACPATLLLIPYIELAFGAWYAEGGLYEIILAIARLAASRGAELHTRSAVDRIAHEGGRVSGIVLADGRRIPADAVVMNGDASNTSSLLGETGAEPLAPSERSLSGVVFLLASRRDLPALAHHTVYFSSDYRREFDQLFRDRRFPDDPTVYVSAPSRTDRSVVPGAGETLFVMANAPAREDDWDADAVRRARERVAERLRRGGAGDLFDGIAASAVWTPRDLAARYRMPGGAIYGAHSHGWRRAFLRPSNRHPRVRGLYLVGGSAHPGGGTPTVLMSARIVAGMIGADDSR